MLTAAQIDVLEALNDLCEIHDGVGLSPDEPLPGPLEDLGLPRPEAMQAVSDLQELDLIEGVNVDEVDHPIRVLRVTARGRQELPSG